jgi:thiamine pyrophosphate-dependent acetolactate synthase large subunit-like protein
VNSTAGELLTRALDAGGVDAIYGEPIVGLDVVRVNAVVAKTVARAHERVHGNSAAWHSGDGTLRIAAAIGISPAPERIVVEDPGDISSLLDVPMNGGIEIRLRTDLRSPTDKRLGQPAGPERWTEPSEQVVDEIRRAGRITVLCGPGVVRNDAVCGLHEMAAAGGLGVLNTWGAKGVFDWRSNHHFATVGLQRDDFALGGIRASDLVIATGIDLLESPIELWGGVPHVTVETSALSRLAELWPVERGTPTMPVLRERLAAVTQSGWTRENAPLSPTRATLSYSRIIGSGVVAADPGVAGYWVARTFATKVLRSAVVPSESDSRGSAVAACLVARLRRRNVSCLAVTDAPISEESELLLEDAQRLGIPIPVEIWGDDGELLSGSDHQERLSRVATGDLDRVWTLATEPDQLAEMIEAAGPVVAWT